MCFQAFKWCGIHYKYTQGQLTHALMLRNINLNLYPKPHIKGAHLVTITPKILSRGRKHVPPSLHCQFGAQPTHRKIRVSYAISIFASEGHTLEYPPHCFSRAPILYFFKSAFYLPILSLRYDSHIAHKDTNQKM